MDIEQGKGKMIVNIESISNKIANELYNNKNDFIDNFEVTTYILDELSTLTDEIESNVQNKIEQKGLEYIKNECMFTNKYKEKAEKVVEKIEEIINDKWLMTNLYKKEFEDYIYYCEFSYDECEYYNMNRDLIDELEKINEVIYCDKYFNDETAEYDFQCTILVNE